MKRPLDWLEEKGPWNMTWHEWLACLCAAPAGGSGFWMIGTALHAGRPGAWAGLLFVLFALFLRSAVLAHDVDNKR